MLRVSPFSPAAGKEERPSSSAHEEESREQRAASGALSSRAARLFLFLLRSCGQTGGSGWLSTIYATIVYALLTYSTLRLIGKQWLIGMEQFSETEAIFTAAMGSSLFGGTQLLAWIPNTCSFLVGRRRYERQLCGLTECNEDLRSFQSHTAWSKVLKRRLLRLNVFSFVSCLVVFLNYIFLLGTETQCKQSAEKCFKTVANVATYSGIYVILYFVTMKFKFSAEIIANGFNVIGSELSRMVDREDIDTKQLNRLRKCHTKLSASFSRLMSGMTPELVSCALYGIIAQISSFLMMVSLTKTGASLDRVTTIILRLWGAVMTVVLPCEVGQMMLSRVSQIRATLLSLPPSGMTISQEVSLFLETTRRDLDELGDISFYRLRRSTVLAITSAVITYIIVFMQFQMTEFE